MPELFANHDAGRRRRTPVALTLLIGCGVLANGTILAQETAKRADIARAASAPQIDGRLEPGEWDGATIIRDLHQVTPVEYADPSVETVFYVMFDESALYVAAVAYDDEPDRITAKTLRQGGSLRDDDTITVLVDAFNNKRSGYSFALNPYGVREDGIYTSGTRLSDDWDGIWRGAAEITADGWTAEMAIPYNTLTFDPGNDTWGFNLRREIKRRNEELAWNSRNSRVNPTVSGELRGFGGLDQGKGLDVIPAISSTALRNHIVNEDDTEVRPSLDVNYKVTPAISLLVTLNTDFSATEVDGRQLDVSRFSLFFPEKRSFFLTDFDIFQFGGVSTGGGGPGGGGGGIPGSQSGTNGLAFYSRRIGLGPSREPVDIIGGVKLSGRIGDTDFGTLYVRQDEFEDIDASDLYVARLTHGILEESSIGVIATSGDPTSNESSSLVGVDFNYRNTRLSSGRALEGWFWVQQSSNDGLEGDDVAWSAALGMPQRGEGWELGAQIHEAQANYDPRLGFANRTGVRLYSGRLGYRWINDDSYWFQRYNQRLDFERWEYLDTGLVQAQQISTSLIDVRTAEDDFVRVGIEANTERLLDGENPLDRLGIDIPPGEYDFNRWSAFVRSANHRPLSFSLRFEGGDFYNGKRSGVRPEIEWQPNEHLAFSLEYDYREYDFPGAFATTRQITFENVVAFNANWSVVTLAQWDNLSNDLGINARLHYNRAAGQDFWLVLNHHMTEFGPLDPEYRNDEFRSVETLLALKFQYTFRF